MDLTVFLKGVLVGFGMAVPIGPIGIMCIRKTLAEGRIHGLIIGLGAATGDLIYGCVASFGLTVVSNTLFTQRFWIRLVGGALLLFMGVGTYFAHSVDPDIHINKNGFLRSYLTIVFLTLTNPLTIFGFIAAFATFGLGRGLGYFSSSVLGVGVSVGSCLWFLSLISGVTLFRKKLNHVRLRWVNRIAGILIFISGLIAIASVL
ncbi:MAG TPA: LysE family transporter [Candidatus Kryptonia bacterium]